MRYLLRFVVVGFTAITMVVVLAVGVAAATGGAKGAPATHSSLVNANGNNTKHEDGKDDNNGHCKGLHKGEHHKSTPAHERKPCGDND